MAAKKRKKRVTAVEFDRMLQHLGKDVSYQLLQQHEVVDERGRVLSDRELLQICFRATLKMKTRLRRWRRAKNAERRRWREKLEEARASGRYSQSTGFHWHRHFAAMGMLKH